MQSVLHRLMCWNTWYPGFKVALPAPLPVLSTSSLQAQVDQLSHAPGTTPSSPGWAVSLLEL